MELKGTTGHGRDGKNDLGMSEIAFRVVKEWDVVKVRITDEGQKRIDLLLSQNRCLGCEEKIAEGEKTKCGLHPTCYHAARRAWIAGRVTRNQLLREGKMLPPAQGGARPINKFTRELGRG